MKYKYRNWMLIASTILIPLAALLYMSYNDDKDAINITYIGLAFCAIMVSGLATKLFPSKSDGIIEVEVGEEGSKLYNLVLFIDPDEIDDMPEVVFKVVPIDK